MRALVTIYCACAVNLAAYAHVCVLLLASEASLPSGTIFYMFIIMYRPSGAHICACVKLFRVKWFKGHRLALETAFCVGETARCIKHDR